MTKKHEKNPFFNLYTGPMFSSKTTSMLAAVDRLQRQGYHILAYKPVIDDRYSNSDISSHNGVRIPAIVANSGAEIVAHVVENAKKNTIVVVDEFFMIPMAGKALETIFKQGWSVMCTSLDLSASFIPFEDVSHVTPWATHIEKRTAVCESCGADAPYTFRKKDLPEIAVGGKDLYEPRCFKCHPGMSDRM